MTAVAAASPPVVAIRPRVLLVDDEEQLLQALVLQLRRDCEVHTAVGGAAALELLAASAPFAVVVSDMRMPGMSGAQFLAEVRRRWPDTVRILLTGQSDLQSAVAAVNEGQIFRFLSKPIPADNLRATLAEAVRQHALVTAERDLLETTLRRSLGVLTDVLSLVNPEAFSCSARVAEIVDGLCDRLQVADRWQVQIAALLSQLGCVTLTPDTARKAYAGQALSAEEQQTFAGHPSVARDLIASIPRMDGVAAIVGSQDEPPRFGVDADLAGASWPDLAAEILRVALRFDRLARRSGRVAAIATMRQGGATHPRLIEALVAFRPSWEGERTASVRFAELRVGMVLRTDLAATSGILLAAAGTVVNATLLLRLANFHASVGLREPIEVLVPADPRPEIKVVSHRR